LVLRAHYQPSAIRLNRDVSGLLRERPRPRCAQDPNDERAFHVAVLEHECNLSPDVRTVDVGDTRRGQRCRPDLPRENNQWYLPIAPETNQCAHDQAVAAGRCPMFNTSGRLVLLQLQRFTRI
jgi:hypothetical protein